MSQNRIHLSRTAKKKIDYKKMSDGNTIEVVGDVHVEDPSALVHDSTQDTTETVPLGPVQEEEPDEELQALEVELQQLKERQKQTEREKRKADLRAEIERRKKELERSEQSQGDVSHVASKQTTHTNKVVTHDKTDVKKSSSADVNINN